jgi:hypothetical protein
VAVDIELEHVLRAPEVEQASYPPKDYYTCQWKKDGGKRSDA